MKTELSAISPVLRTGLLCRISVASSILQSLFVVVEPDDF